MIYNFVRDNSYFQTLFENNVGITSKDFDNEFNNFINFLNKKVVSSINNISSSGYNGVTGSNNFILKNIGNGKVVFDKLKDIHYQNNSIKLSKLKKTQPYSLLYVDTNFTLQSLKLTNDDEKQGDGIFGYFDNVSLYENKIKIEGKNFYDKSIKTNNILSNAITKNHISDDGKLFLLKNIKIEPHHIIDKSISTDNFAKYSITYDKLHSEIKDIREKNDNLLTYENDSITFDKVKNNSFDFSLISNNLNKFGNGILHKSVIPLYSVPISIPDEDNSETIDTYKLCIYSIANAYEVKTYKTEEQTIISANPEYSEKNEEYNNISEQLNHENNILNQLGQHCIVGKYFITSNMINANRLVPNGETLLTDYIERKRQKFETINENVYKYETQNQKCVNLQIARDKLYEELQKIPQNIELPVAGSYYKVLELVGGEKSYTLDMKQQCIKSGHLKDNMFNIENIPDRTTHLNVTKEKFINKYKLSPELREKLGLHI